MADEAIEIPIVVTGDRQADAALQKTASGVAGVGRAASTATPVIAGAGQAMDAKAQNAAKLSSVMGGLSPVIGQASSSAAKMTSVFSTAGATISGMTSLIGGPFGLAMGAAVAATGLLVASMNEAEAAATAEREAVEKATLSLEDYVAAAAKARGARELQRRIATGTATEDEATGAQNQALADRNKLLAKRAEVEQHIARIEAANNPQLASRLRFAQDQLQATNDQIAATDATIASLGRNLIAVRQVEGEKKAIEENERARHSAARNRSALSAADMERELESILKITDARVAAADAEERRMQRIRAAGVFSQSINRSQADLMNEASIGSVTGSSSRSAANDNGGAQNDEFFSRIQRDSAAFRSDDADVKAKAHEDAANRIKGAYSEAYGAIADAGTQAFAAIVTGQDVAVGALLSGVGQQLAAQGLKHAFEGTARTISSWGADPSGPALIGIGAAEIAAGAGLGAIGNAATPSASAGASGGPPKPADQMGSGGGENGSHTTIVLNNLVPDAYAGERVAEALDARRHKRGRVAA